MKVFGTLIERFLFHFLLIVKTPNISGIQKAWRSLRIILAGQNISVCQSLSVPIFCKI